jgi:hypothetical protein
MVDTSEISLVLARLLPSNKRAMNGDRASLSEAGRLDFYRLEAAVSPLFNVVGVMVHVDVIRSIAPKPECFPAVS